MDAFFLFFFFQAEDGIRDADVTGVQTCALPICRELAAAAATAAAARAAELEGEQDDQRQQQHEAHGQLSAPAAGLATQLRDKGQGRPGPIPNRPTVHTRSHSHQLLSLGLDPGSPPTSARNASSSRRRGTTRSTSIPALTRAATTAARGVPSRSTSSEPLGSRATLPTPARRKTSAAAAGSDTSNCVDGESPITSSTGPAATTSPR